MKRMKVIAGIILIVAGIVLIATPFYHEWKQEKELHALDEALAMIEDDDQGADDNTSYDVADRSFSKEELENVYELEIPSIDLNQKILGETTEDNLSMALTQIKQNQSPGEGNFTIAGHRGYRGDRHFRELPGVAIGDEVKLHANSATFVYEVNSSEVIEATETEVLDDKDGADEITLITCTIGGQQRIAVQGDLVNVIED